MWAGYGERSVDDMLQLRLHVVYLDEADYQQQVADRIAKQRPTPTGQQQQQQPPIDSQPPVDPNDPPIEQDPSVPPGDKVPAQ